MAIATLPITFQKEINPIPDRTEPLKFSHEISYTADFTIKQTIDVCGKEELDTRINIDGSLTVAGCTRKAFIVEFEELCDKYRI